MDFETDGHIYPQSDEQAAALSTDFRAGLTADASSEGIAAAMVAEQRCVGISDELIRALRVAVCAEFGVAPDAVQVVGSSKLGFSIADKAHKGKPRYRPFTAASDIDIAVIDGGLFDELWKGTFQEHVRRKWYHHNSPFAQFLFKGWFRPDKLPFGIPQRNRWFDFFAKLSGSIHLSEMSVTGGLYKSPEFLLAYQRIAVDQCIADEKLRVD